MYVRCKELSTGNISYSNVRDCCRVIAVIHDLRYIDVNDQLLTDYKWIDDSHHYQVIAGYLDENYQPVPKSKRKPL